jgi:hypothetical protein
MTEHRWRPGLHINGRTVTTRPVNAFGVFAYDVHTDLLAARDAERIPRHVGIAVTADRVAPLFDGNPPTYLIRVEFAAPKSSTPPGVDDQVFTEARLCLDHRAPEHVAACQVDQYAGTVAVVDKLGRTRAYRHHALRPHPLANARPKH